MLQAANMSEMAWFFHRERLPSANAWTMALVATEACPGFQAEQVSMCLGKQNCLCDASHDIQQIHEATASARSQWKMPMNC